MFDVQYWRKDFLSLEPPEFFTIFASVVNSLGKTGWEKFKEKWAPDLASFPGLVAFEDAMLYVDEFAKRRGETTPGDDELDEFLQRYEIEIWRTVVDPEDFIAAILHRFREGK